MQPQPGDLVVTGSGDCVCRVMRPGTDNDFEMHWGERMSDETCWYVVPIFVLEFWSHGQSMSPITRSGFIALSSDLHAFDALQLGRFVSNVQRFADACMAEWKQA